MGGLQAWHWAALGCVVVVLAGIGAVVYLAVRAATRKKQ